jgi:hypothetical protein
MLDESGIYLGYIWDISRLYPGDIYIPDKSWIYMKYIPEYIPIISGMSSQIYLGGSTYPDVITKIQINQTPHN